MGSIKFNTNRTKVELTGITETESSTLSGKGKQTSILPTYKPNFKDVNLTTIQAQARTPVFKSVTTPRKYTTPTKKPKIELPDRDPFTQEEVMLLQHQSRIPMAMPKSDLRDKAAINTEYALKSNPSMYGRMEGFSPLATKKQVGKMLGQEIDTTGAEDTLGYKVGYGAGLMGQYMITGGIAHTGVRQGLTRMIPQLANQAGRSNVKNVLGTIGASALTDVLTGVPVNTLQAIKESTIGDNVNWNQFAKSFAVNTGIDIVFGGLIEGALVLKSGKKIKTVGDLKTVTPDESKEITEQLMLNSPKYKENLMLNAPTNKLLNIPQKQLTQPVNYVDELGNISNDPNFNAAKNVLQEEPYVKNKIKVTVKRPSGIYEKLDDDWDFGWDSNDINSINDWIEFSKSHGKTPTKLLKSQLNKTQIEIDKAFDEAKDYFLNYQGKGVDLVEMVDLPGRKVRKSLNDEWYRRWYKENKKAPTKKDKLQIAEEEFMEDIRAASDGNRDGQFVSEELAKRYSFFNKLENMFNKLPDDTINVELRGEDDMSAFIGQETSIVKPDYTKKPFIERVETPKRVYAGELPQGSKLPENTLSKKIIEKKKAEPIILGGKVETPTNIKQPTIAKRTPLKKVEQELPNLETKYVSGLKAEPKADTKIPTKFKSVEAELKSLTAEMKVTPPTETQIKRYKQLKAQVKPAKIPAREPVSTVEPLKADKPTVAPKAKTMEPKATKTVDAKVDSMGGEKSFFNKIDDVTERNKAKEKLSEKIKFTNKEGRQVTKTRKDYIEDASSIYGSHIETIKRQTTDSPKSSTLYEYRLYKRPTSTKFTKLSKYEKEYFEYAKSKQPEMPKIFTEKTSFNKKPFKETPLTKQSPPKPKPKPDVSELVLTSAKESRKPRKERLYDAGLDTKRKMVDSGDTVAVISKITGDDSIYHAYNKARSASRTGDHMIGEAQVNINNDVVGESLESIFKPIRDKGDGYYKEFETYLLHKHNVDRMAQGKPVFGKHITADMSIREADRLLREYPEFEQLAQKVYKYNRNIMQYRIDAGLVTLDEANMWANMYPHYVPIARMEKSISKVAAHAKTQKTKKISKTVMEAVGDDTKIVPIHVSMSRQTMTAVKEAETNLFANRLVDSASVKTAKYLQDSTLMKKGVPLEDLIEGELPYLKNGFHLFRDGKVYEVKVDEGLFEAIQALSPSAKSPNIMYEGAMFVNKTFKQLVTSYSPPFLLKNFVRDVPDAMLYSIDSKEFIKQFPNAMKEIKTNGPLWQKYKAMGGMSSSFFDYAKGYKGDSSFIRRNTVDRIEHLNMLTEQLPRFTEFLVTLSKGDKSYDNFLEALFNSADVTVNFGKKGTWGKVINETAVPFFNPSIQGFDKAIRFFKNNKGAKRWAVVIKKAALLGIAPSVINEIIYGDDTSYQKLRNRDKDLHYIFKVGEDFWLRVPKGRVISVIGGVPQRTVRKIRGEENAYADFLKSSAEQIAPVSPLTSNLYSPIIHAETNKAWHGGAIVPYGLVNKAAEKQFDEGTTSMSKWLGGKLKYSPKKIDYLVDAYTGIIGDLAMPLMTKKADMHPFIKAFTIDGVTSNKISNTFYEKKTEVSQLKDEGYVVGYIQNRYLGKQASMVSKLFDEITEIQLSNMSDTKKYTKVRELRALINGVQQNALDSLTEIEKATKKLEKKYEDSDDLYREVNKEVFGSEYALKLYNKTVYEKAQTYVTEKAAPSFNKNVATIPQKNGITWDNYYDGYFAQKDKPSDIGKAVALKSENIDTLFVAFGISDKNARIGAAIYENDLSYIYETTYKRIGENNATKSAEKIAIIRQHNPNLTRQQLNILYEAFNVAESIGGYRRQFK